MRSDDGKDEKERMTQEPDSVIVLRLLGPYLWGGGPPGPTAWGISSPVREELTCGKVTGLLCRGSRSQAGRTSSASPLNLESHS